MSSRYGVGLVVYCLFIFCISGLEYFMLGRVENWLILLVMSWLNFFVVI